MIFEGKKVRRGEGQLVRAMFPVVNIQGDFSVFEVFSSPILQISQTMNDPCPFRFHLDLFVSSLRSES